MPTALWKALSRAAFMTAIAMAAATGAELIAFGNAEDIWWCQLLGVVMLLGCGGLIERRLR